MTPLPRTPRGDATRDRILEIGLRLARKDGLEGVTIGSLAEALGMSKSGLFAHFGSKEELQVALLEDAVRRFETQVIRPALRAPRGLPRLEGMLERWLGWISADGQGGCVFLAASSELDDRPGKPRDALVASQAMWLSTLEKAARLAVAEGHLEKNLDCAQLAFELYGVMMSYHVATRLLGDTKAKRRARVAFDRLLLDAKNPN